MWPQIPPKLSQFCSFSYCSKYFLTWKFELKRLDFQKNFGVKIENFFVDLWDIFVRISYTVERHCILIMLWAWYIITSALNTFKAKKRNFFLQAIYYTVVENPFNCLISKYCEQSELHFYIKNIWIFAPKIKILSTSAFLVKIAKWDIFGWFLNNFQFHSKCQVNLIFWNVKFFSDNSRVGILHHFPSSKISIWDFLSFLLFDTNDYHDIPLLADGTTDKKNDIFWQKYRSSWGKQTSSIQESYFENVR